MCCLCELVACLQAHCAHICVYFGSGLSLGSYAVGFASWYFDLVTHGQCDNRLCCRPLSLRFLFHSCPRYLFVCWHLQFIYFYYIYFTPACTTKRTAARTFSLWYPVNCRKLHCKLMEIAAIVSDCADHLLVRYTLRLPSTFVSLTLQAVWVEGGVVCVVHVSRGVSSMIWRCATRCSCPKAALPVPYPKGLLACQMPFIRPIKVPGRNCPKWPLWHRH